MAPPRLLSHTEIATAQTCWARHAFAYTGRLTEGRTLKSRHIARVLSEGRAWGVAVARWHQQGHTLLAAVEAADGLRMSLDADELEMIGRGVSPSLDDRLMVEDHLLDVFGHYATLAEPLGNLIRLEDEVLVPIPSRTGRRSSTRYAFVCFIDGWYCDPDGNPWLVEFKLRSRLSPVALIARSRQIRWYAWALRKARGINPVGVIYDERLNVAPKAPRMLIDGRISAATNQVTTVEAYLEACEETGTSPVTTVVNALRDRVWQQRVPILFGPRELDEAGEELVSAAKLIRDLDSGELYPLRNAMAHICNGCRFKDICANPEDELFVQSQFEYTIPKRERGPL